MSSNLTSNKKTGESVIFSSFEEYMKEDRVNYVSQKGKVDRAKVTAEILDSSRKLVSEASTLIFGSSIEQVAATTFIFLAECEYKNLGPHVIKGLLFSFMLSQTTSSNLYTYYRELESPHMFEKFEISNRDDRKSDRALWERGSRMNGTAIRLIGQMVLECAYRSRIPLAIKIVNEKGSIFRTAKVNQDVETKYTQLCNENFVGDAKEELMEAWCEIFKHPVSIVMSAFSGAVSDWKLIAEKTKDINRRNI